MQPINRQDLEAMNANHDSDFVLINVLSPEDFNKEHIRTSINIPKSDPNFVDQVERVAADKDREVVVYCANFDCPASREAAQKLDKAGFSKVYDYEGGTKDWLNNHR